MKPLRSLVDKVMGLRFVVDELPLSFSASKNYLLDMEVPTDKVTIEDSYHVLTYFVGLDEQKNQLLVHYLAKAHDITRSLENLSEGEILDDIELYEIKHLAYIAIKIGEIIDGKYVLEKETCEETFRILDPCGNRQDSFYVYDVYSGELAALRREKKQDDAMAEERKVLAELSGNLRPLANKLIRTLLSLMTIDLYQAKTKVYRKYHFCKPSFSEKGVQEIKSMFNPQLMSLNGEQYQVIDIKLRKGSPTFLIGMNMGGKTVTLNTIMLTVILAQIGFGCPAQSATLEICTNLGGYSADQVKNMKGLSSFGNELKALDQIIADGHKSERTSFFFVDEPARTTNPVEGEALVKGFVEVMKSPNTFLLIATHYNITMRDCTYWRVRGIRENRIDYDIDEVSISDVPNEAITVAKMLGVNDKWIEKAKNYL